MLGKLRLVAALGCGLVLMAGRIQAGMIIASGDTSIVEGLGNNGGAVAANPGNQTFFTNVLGGGSVVRVLNTTNGNNFTGSGTFSNANAAINNFYNGVAGASSAILTGPVTGASLAGVNLLVVDLPDAGFAASEIAAVTGFLAGGGRVFFLGEANGYSPSGDAAINADLTGLGSVLRLTTASIDGGAHTATAANKQILGDPLAAGVASFGYAYVTGVTGGSAVFLASDTATAFVAEQATPNLATVPEPASLVTTTLGAAIGLGFGRVRRRRAAGAP